MKLLAPWLSTLIAITPLGAQPLYKWVDESGETHFSDKPPEDNQTSTEEIGDNLPPLNINESGDRQKDLEAVFPRETAAERAFRLEQEEQERQAREARQEQCNRAREMLEKMRGPVVFFDREGRQQQVSEEERARRETELAAAIQRNCD